MLYSCFRVDACTMESSKEIRACVKSATLPWKLARQQFSNKGVLEESYTTSNASVTEARKVQSYTDRVRRPFPPLLSQQVRLPAYIPATFSTKAVPRRSHRLASGSSCSYSTTTSLASMPLIVRCSSCRFGQYKGSARESCKRMQCSTVASAEMRRKDAGSAAQVHVGDDGHECGWRV